MLADPETLWGPLLHLLTRETARGDACAASGDALLQALAAHAGVAPLLRLVAFAMIDAPAAVSTGTSNGGRRSILHTGSDSPGT